MGAPLDLIRAAYETDGKQWKYFWIKPDAQPDPSRKLWKRFTIAAHPFHAADAVDEAKHAISNLIAVWGQKGPLGYVDAMLLAGFSDELFGNEPLPGLKTEIQNSSHYQRARQLCAQARRPDPNQEYSS